MSLTNNDLKKIDNLVKANVECVNARIDKMEEGMNHRFDENDRPHGMLNAKIDRLDKRGDEDIAAAFDDISSIKSRLRKAKI